MGAAHRRRRAGISLVKGLALILPVAAALVLSSPFPPAARAAKRPPAGDLRDALGIVLEPIPGGAFLMGARRGAADERPPHRVVVSPFLLGRTEVTVGQFRRFVEATGFVSDAERAKTRSWRDPSFGQSDDHPVVNVSWNDAAAFCAWTGTRLPTEAEWEYAAGNGPAHTTFSWGNHLPEVPAGNVIQDETVLPGHDDGYRFPAPVATYAANPMGLHDMTGNVEEWCADWYDDKWYSASPESNPRGPATGVFHVVRGGAWNSPARRLGITRRKRYAPNFRAAYIGFRVAADR
jgi:formylglycine-generating enzyme required for sulfatase activity